MSPFSVFPSSGLGKLRERFGDGLLVRREILPRIGPALQKLLSLLNLILLFLVSGNIRDIMNESQPNNGNFLPSHHHDRPRLPSLLNLLLPNTQPWNTFNRPYCNSRYLSTHFALHFPPLYPLEINFDLGPRSWHSRCQRRRRLVSKWQPYGGIYRHYRRLDQKFLGDSLLVLKS